MCLIQKVNRKLFLTFYIVWRMEIQDDSLILLTLILKFIDIILSSISIQS